MNVSVKYRVVGEVTLLPLFAKEAWNECVELQSQPQEDWILQVIADTTEFPRIEITVDDGAEYLGGCILVIETQEMHVGKCMSVMTQYVPKRHRNLGVSRLLMREAIKHAKAFDCPMFAYSHRVGPFKYLTTYKAVR